MKIPKGWRKLRRGTRIQYGDMCKNKLDLEWSLTGMGESAKVGWDEVCKNPLTYIRRIKKGTK